MAYFKNPNDPDNSIISAKIKEWMHTYHNIAEVDVLEIIEIPCHEPNCPDIYTKITYLMSHQRRELIIHKPLVFVRKIDFVGKVL